MTETEPSQEAPNEPTAMTQSAYNPNQAPVLLSYVAATRGLVPPDPASSYVYCEVGCGRGLTLNSLAAANPQSRFIGIDPNAGALAQARRLALAGELTNVEFIEAEFEALGELDLPESDYVVLHGIYSRMTDADLGQLYELLTKHLRPGGLFYVEYLSLPGNTDVTATLDLWRELSGCLAGDEDESVVAGLRSLESLREAKAPFFRTHPLAGSTVQRYSKLGASHPEALRHIGRQLLSGVWRPRFFSEIAREMGALGLTYAGSTELPINDLALCIPEDDHAHFTELTNPIAIEMLKDTLRNHQQRRDVFMRDAESRPAEARAFLNDHFHLIPRPPQPVPEVSVPLPGGGAYKLSGPVHSAVLNVLAEGPKRVADLLGTSELKNADPEEVAIAAQRLVAAGYCILALTGEVRAPLRVLSGELAYSNGFNRALVAQASQHLWRVTLPSPVTGGGAVTLMPMESVFLHLLMTMGSDNIATAAKGHLEGIDKTFVMDGNSVAARDLDLKTIRTALTRFRTAKLANLFRFAIVESPRADLSLEGSDDVFEFE